MSWFTLLSDQNGNTLLIGCVLSSVSAVAGFLGHSAQDPMRDVLGPLRNVTERARAATDAALNRLNNRKPKRPLQRMGLSASTEELAALCEPPRTAEPRVPEALAA